MKSLHIQTLPLNGRHIIEASAGTGKTFNITELYLRLILEKKLMPKQILVMTFTKDATQEIISRVEAKIREAIDPKKPEEAVQYSHDELILLKQALAEIDEASIFTIHGFCKKVLSEYAIDSGIEMDIAMEVDSSDLLRKCVEAYFRAHINHSPERLAMLTSFGLQTPEKCLGKGGIAEIIKSHHPILQPQPISLGEINQAKQSQLALFEANPAIVSDFLCKAGKGEIEGARAYEYELVTEWLKQREIQPFPSQIKLLTNGNKIKAKAVKEVFNGLKEVSALYDQYVSSQASEFIKSMCEQLRRDFILAKQAKGILDFDDLIRNVSLAVQRSDALVAQLQTQFPVALIDEFQDTDVQQYTILNTLYPKENKDLLFLMIGDPKQAIYGFRGGDIYTYLKAKKSSDYQWNMDTNWRSTKEMIRAYNRLFVQKDYDADDAVTENVFGAGIDYSVVKPSAKADDKKRGFGDNLPPIHYFYYDSDVDTVDPLRQGLVTWCANEVVQLLKQSHIQEKDIAILVSNGNQANLIQKAFNDCNLSTVYLSQRDRVFDSPEAQELLYLMEGIANYGDRSLLKRALSTSLMGGNASQFIRYSDDDGLDEWDQAIQSAKGYYQHWHKHGFISLVVKLIHEKLILRDKRKERFLTNILHLAELIRMASNRYKQIPQLIKWYRQQMNERTQGVGELRLESDDNLIKIVTIHSSKGLEYPVVFIPFACDGKASKDSNIKKFYNDENTVYSLGKDKAHQQLVESQSIEETVRLLYVAVTRAESRCYIGVAPFKNVEKSPLYKLLDCQSKDELLTKVTEITDNGDNHSHLTTYETVDTQAYTAQQSQQVQTLQAQTPPENLEDGWWMMSFSSLTKQSAPLYDFERPLEESEDEADVKAKATAFRFAVKKGATIGNVLHNVLEESDFSSGKINDDILRQQLAIYPIQDENGEYAFKPIKEWLEACLVTPIPVMGTQQTFTLKDLPKAQTLREAEFHFPVENEHACTDDISQILAQYRGVNKIDNKLYSNKVFGMLNGFIDLIFEHQGRYYVADYKSNHLGDDYEDYQYTQMQAKNQKSFYDLQYLIYCVAVDRYLQQRLGENYQYERDFGGVYYFYLRGMTAGYGVYATKPPYGIIQQLSQLFAGGEQ